MGIGGAARKLWIEMHDQIEASIPGDLKPIKALASKAAEHLGRIAGVLTLISDPQASGVTEDAMQRAALLVEFYLAEALRLSGVQPQHEKADQAAVLWTWLMLRGKKHITLPELTQTAPNKMRKAETLRSLMGVLADHYMVRMKPMDTVEYGGKVRREAWEIRR